jgi:hypothetical protein
VLDDFLRSHPDVRVVNQTTRTDGEPYKSLGDVRNASLQHADGDIYICWDDDDLFMPWHISKCMEGLDAHPTKAWKPNVSYFSRDGGSSFQGLMGNSMEASFVVNMNHVKAHGFSTKRSGAEHVDGGWLSETNFVEKFVSPFESYGYIWGDERCPHKTSGNIGDDNNFENHKSDSADFGDKPLSIFPINILDKFFKSALDVWENPSTHEGMSGEHSTVTPEDVEKLRGMMRNVYHRHMVSFPDFLQLKDDVEEEGGEVSEIEAIKATLAQLQKTLAALTG